MIERLLPGGLRGRLILAISAITLAILGGSFIALHERTGSDLQDRLDQDLREQYAEFEQQALRSDVTDPAELQRASKHFIASQRYHPDSRIFLISIKGGTEVTNQRGVVEKQVEHEFGEPGERAEKRDAAKTSLFDAPAGIATISTEETGRLRVYTHPIAVGGERLGTFRVADPLDPVDQAQEGLRDAILVVGIAALLLSVAAAVWVASLVTRPLRQMARFASAVDAGDLAQRVEPQGGSKEVRALADSFNKMLDRLQDAFDRQRDFVADASHELRTPLTVLRGEIELLERDRLSAGDEPDRERALLREVRRMERLVDDLLTLAAAESDRMIDRRTIDLEDFFADLQRDLPLLGERDYRVTAATGALDADPDRLAQVLRNLVSNAVTHTEPGATIRVTAKAAGDRLQLAVADEGPGIPPDQLDRVFDRFHRTDPGRGRDSGGSGLGLAIVRALVEAHGGTIWAESPPGKGATFRLELPGYRPGPSEGPADADPDAQTRQRAPSI